MTDRKNLINIREDKIMLALDILALARLRKKLPTDPYFVKISKMLDYPDIVPQETGLEVRELLRNVTREVWVDKSQ